MSADPVRLPLRELQRWLAQVIRHPQTADVAVRSAKARALVPIAAVERGMIVRPNDRMSATDRVQVYNGAYLARLVECMAVDYPLLRALIGADRFHALVAAYVEKHPSRHPNLNRFGKLLPSFMARRRGLPHHAFAVDLATLELAMSDAFDAPEFEPLDPQQLAAVPPERWDGARLRTNPSLRLLALRHPVNGWYQAQRDGEPIAVPGRGKTWLSVYRHDDRIWRAPLSAPAYRLLAALAAGSTMSEALAGMQGEADVGVWFREWSAAGLFTAVELDSPRRRPARRR